MKTFALAALLSTATALLITSPTTSSSWDLSSTNTITWTSVSTDPKEFSLVLVDKSTTPESQLVITDKVETSKGKYDLTNFVVPGFKPSAANSTTPAKYSIKALSTDPKNTGQLSESGAFEVTKSGVSSSTKGPSPTGSGPAPTDSTKGNAAAGVTAGIAGLAAGVVAAAFALLL